MKFYFSPKAVATDMPVDL